MFLGKNCRSYTSKNDLETNLSSNFVCQQCFCHSKPQYNHCGRSICVPRQLYTWFWTKKRLDWLKKHFRYFWLHPYIDMWGINFYSVTSNGSWFYSKWLQSHSGLFFHVIHIPCYAKLLSMWPLCFKNSFPALKNPDVDEIKPLFAM